MALHLDIGMIKETFTRFNADKAPRLAAALSFTTIFAIAPVLIIVIAIVGGIIAAHRRATGTATVPCATSCSARSQASAGKGAADAVRAMVQTAFDKPRQSLIAQIVGWVTLRARRGRDCSPRCRTRSTPSGTSSRPRRASGRRSATASRRSGC